MIKFALAVPRHEFIKDAFEIFKQHNETGKQYDIEDYSMEEVIITDKTLKSTKIEADVIITRGLFAEIFKSIQGDIPIIEIPVPATDTLRVVLKCMEKFKAKKVGIIASHNMVMGATEIQDFLKISVNTYILTQEWNGPQLVDQAIKDGCDAIVGGVNTCSYASSINVPNMFIETGRDSFWQSITAAKRAAEISRIEQEKSSRMQILLNTSKEGLISIDAQNRIRTINHSAIKILKLEEDITGMRVMDAPFTIELKKLLLANTTCTNEILKYKDTMLTINKYPVMVQHTNMGIVVIFQSVSDIMFLENDIRRKIYNKGHVAKMTFDDITGISAQIKNTIETAKKYSRTNSNVLLIGQSGTGKEMFAQSIHNHSLRKEGPFVAVNCAAIPDNLLESELFGYTAGAFTGARKNGKQGYFELAHNGTLFLDEIGEIPLQFQAKLLRAIQEREIMPIGSDKVLSINVRIIAATNKNLEKLVEKEEFREDLLYRLDVLRINIPPLSQRKEDIPILVKKYFLQNAPETTITKEACKALINYKWNGNIRQLFNICERLSVLKQGETITEKDIYDIMPDYQKISDAIYTEEVKKENTTSDNIDEKSLIISALEKCRYNKQKTAAYLGISRSTLWKKINEYNIET